MPEKNQFKRRTVFIKKAFQGRFIITVLMMILLFGFCSAGLIYWLINSDLHAQSQSAHGNISNTWARLGLSILMGNLVAVIIAGIPTVFFVLYISHKIAGPLYRFEQACEQIGDGNLDTVTQLRKQDQLQDLSIAFTTMSDKLRARQQQRQQNLAAMENQLKALKTMQQLSPQQSHVIAELEHSIQQLLLTEK